jgi:rare lipoprotein A
MARSSFVFLALAVLASGTAGAAPAPELDGALAGLPAHAPVTVQAYLQRLRQPVAAPAPSAGAGYVPRTAHDNSPYRFDMTQNGRRMTAEEFAAWMKARGIRVATGKPAGTAAPAAAPAAATAQACQPTATTAC